MGGFMINGIGAADSFYPIKTIGRFQCPSCRCEQSFALMTVKLKVRVVFIPTVTLNTKYAVACENCKSGFYIEERSKNDILNKKVDVWVDENGVELIPVEKKAEQKIDYSTMTEAKDEKETIIETKPHEEAKPQVVAEVSSDVKKCPHCGMTVENESLFCAFCGKKVLAETPVEDKKICPKCNKEFEKDRLFCNMCGGTLINKAVPSLEIDIEIAPATDVAGTNDIETTEKEIIPFKTETPAVHTAEYTQPVINAVKEENGVSDAIFTVNNVELHMGAGMNILSKITATGSMHVYADKIQIADKTIKKADIVYSRAGAYNGRPTIEITKSSTADYTIVGNDSDSILKAFALLNS